MLFWSTWESFVWDFFKPTSADSAQQHEATCCWAAVLLCPSERYVAEPKSHNEVIGEKQQHHLSLESTFIWRTFPQQLLNDFLQCTYVQKGGVELVLKPHEAPFWGRPTDRGSGYRGSILWISVKKQKVKGHLMTFNIFKLKSGFQKGGVIVNMWNE